MQINAGYLPSIWKISDFLKQLYSSWLCFSLSHFIAFVWTFLGSIWTELEFKISKSKPQHFAEVRVNLPNLDSQGYKLIIWLQQQKASFGSSADNKDALQ